MKIAIIGSGPSGLYSAILLKRNNPSYEIHVFDKEEKLAKKLYATGNGHCNLLNKKLLPNKFNNPQYFKNILKDFPYPTLKKELNDLGVSLLEDDDYVYPLSFHAGTYVKYLLSLAERLGVVFHNNARINDYRKANEGFELENYDYFDKLVIATGGKSSKNLGSDGLFFDILKKHGYQVNDLRPGLAPLKIKENVKSLQGVRHHALIKASVDNKQIFQEEGELLFKKDGLSGIVIFNAESAIYRVRVVKNPKISVDLFPELSLYNLCDILLKAKENNPKNYLSSILPLPLENYILSLCKNQDVSNIATNLKHLIFTVTGSYGFDDSQVSIGGVSLNEVSPFLESNKERGLYIIGEALDIDGNCGGYNLTWSLISALLISKHI